MPQLTDITVKKKDGTTDIVYTGLVASSGDKSPAIWRSPVGLSPAFKPALRVTTQGNGPGSSRVLKAEFRFPITATGPDGAVKQVDLPRMELTVHLPQAVAQIELDEFVHQGLNLFASTALKAQATSGYAAT